MLYLAIKWTFTRYCSIYLKAQARQSQFSLRFSWTYAKQHKIRAICKVSLGHFGVTTSTGILKLIKICFYGGWHHSPKKNCFYTLLPSRIIASGTNNVLFPLSRFDLNSELINQIKSLCFRILQTAALNWWGKPAKTSYSYRTKISLSVAQRRASQRNCRWSKRKKATYTAYSPLIQTGSSALM